MINIDKILGRTIKVVDILNIQTNITNKTEKLHQEETGWGWCIDKSIRYDKVTHCL